MKVVMGWYGAMHCEWEAYGNTSTDADNLSVETAHRLQFPRRQGDDSTMLALVEQTFSEVKGKVAEL